VNKNVYVELRKSRLPIAQRWRFRIKGRNGRVLASSEWYHNQADMLAAVDLIFGYGNVEIETRV
jgi:uncharacterized protein YegP (UPF0339 family)